MLEMAINKAPLSRIKISDDLEKFTFYFCFEKTEFASQHRQIEQVLGYYRFGYDYTCTYHEDDRKMDIHYLKVLGDYPPKFEIDVPPHLWLIEKYYSQKFSEEKLQHKIQYVIRTLCFHDYINNDQLLAINEYLKPRLIHLLEEQQKFLQAKATIQVDVDLILTQYRNLPTFFHQKISSDSMLAAAFVVLEDIKKHNTDFKLHPLEEKLIYLLFLKSELNKIMYKKELEPFLDVLTPFKTAINEFSAKYEAKWTSIIEPQVDKWPPPFRENYQEYKNKILPKYYSQSNPRDTILGKNKGVPTRNDDERSYKKQKSTVDSDVWDDIYWPFR